VNANEDSAGTQPPETHQRSPVKVSIGQSVPQPPQFVPSRQRSTSQPVASSSSQSKRPAAQPVTTHAPPRPPNGRTS
jgi:hypothetical protein